MGISLDKRLRVYARDGYRCVECGFQTSRERTIELIGRARLDHGRFPRPELLTIDHVVPRSRGGSNDEDNLQTLCAPCNTLKGDKLPEGCVSRPRPSKAKPKKDVPLGERPVVMFAKLGYLARFEGARHEPGCDPMFGCVGHCVVRLLAGYPIT